jgi:hypothetical protein
MRGARLEGENRSKSLPKMVGAPTWDGEAEGDERAGPTPASRGADQVRAMRYKRTG